MSPLTGRIPFCEVRTKVKLKIKSMQTCKECGRNMQRVPRAVVQRLVCRAAFKCPNCGSSRLLHCFSYRLESSACCPQCGNPDVQRLRDQTHFDRRQSGLWNLLSRLFGGRLYLCP